MKAVVFDDYGAPDVLYVAELAIPDPGPGKILVKVMAAAVNPADGKWRDGTLRPLWELAFPHVLGHEVAGVVEAVGPGVTEFAPGDRVVTLFEKVTHGGYAEYALGDDHATALLPFRMDYDLACAIPVAGLTGAQMIEEIIRPARGETVLVTGAVGAVGRFAVHAAKDAGARVIAAVRPGHREEALTLHADRIVLLDGTVPDCRLDHVADTVGGAAAHRFCRLVPPGGRICTAATDPIDPAGLSAEPVFVVLHQDGKPRPAGGRCRERQGARTDRAAHADGRGGRSPAIGGSRRAGWESGAGAGMVGVEISPSQRRLE